MLNLLVVSGVFPWALNLLIGFFVLAKNPRNVTNRKFCIFSSSIAFWSVGSFVVQPQVISSLPAAVFAAKICYFAACFLPILFLDFACSVSGTKIKNSIILPGLYLFAVVLSIFLFGTNLFLISLRELPHLHFRVSQPGPIYYLFFAYFCMCIFGALTILLKGIRVGPLTKSNQLKYVFFAYLVAALSGFEYFLTVFGIVPYPPIDDYILIFAIPILSYAIVRHRLMDIEVIIKKTIVFAGLFSVFMAIVSAVTALAQSYLGLHVRMGPITSSLASVLIAVMLYDPVRKFLVNATDTYLFQKKDDFKIILNRLAKNIISILDIHEVGETVLNTLQESLRLETGALIIRDEKNKHYSLLNAFNVNPIRQKFSSDCEFIRYFSESDKNINLEKPDAKNMLPEEVVKNLEALMAVICVPLFAHGELIGLLTMGKKRSDQEFTQEEIDYLPVVAGQTAIAIRNAQLVNDVIREREEKVKALNKAEQVNYASSLSHETGNALVGITSTSQNISEGLVQDLRKLIKYCENKLDANLRKRYEEIADKIYRFSKTIEQNSEKVRIIIKTATGGLKDNRSEKEEMSFRFVWNHAKKEANINDVHYDGQMPDPFIVFGNTSLLTRVLVNLFINSRDAMIHIVGERCIHLEASFRAFEGRQVAWIEYWDDGTGIPEELFAKVFEQGFSTKPKPKGPMGLDSGYGQGLYYCRKFIEEFHKGRIWLEKRDAGGSKFVFWIPADREENGEEK